MSEREVLNAGYYDHFSIRRVTSILEVETGQTHQMEVTILSKIACALSQNKKSGFSMEDGAGKTSGSYLLFTMPEIEVQAGDRLLIQTETGMRVTARAGKPFRYCSHQEIPLSEEGFS